MTPLIIAFDFDNTITKISMSQEYEIYKKKWANKQFKGSYWYSKNDHLINDMIDDIGIKNIMSKLFDDQFVEYLRMLKLKYPIDFIITSFGYKKVIENVLRRANSDLMLYVISEVITPEDYNLKEGYDNFQQLDGKNKMLYDAMETYGVSDPKNVLLIDDNLPIIENANPIFCTIYVSTNKGMTKYYKERINDFLRDQLSSNLHHE